MKHVRGVVAGLLLMGVLAAVGYFVYPPNPVQQAKKPDRALPQKSSEGLQEICSEPTQDEDMMSTQVCTYKTRSFGAVYERMRSHLVDQAVAKLLEKALPERSLSVAPKDTAVGVVGIDYRFEGPDRLQIEVQFEGGVDSYRFVRQHGQVALEITHAAD